MLISIFQTQRNASAKPLRLHFDELTSKSSAQRSASAVKTPSTFALKNLALH